MRPTHLTQLIACSVVILLWAATYSQPGVEAQSAARDETSGSPSHAWAAEPAMSPAAQLAAAVHAERSSVSLSPAVAMVKCKLGQSYSQTLTLTNQTRQELAFEMMAEDVVVRDGKRVFVAAGETPAGIAATAVFGQKEVVVKPLQSSSVVVTFTVPPETPLRAVVAAFRGSTKISSGGVVKMMASLGTLFTFTVSENSRIETSPIVLTPQSATANLGISQILQIGARNRFSRKAWRRCSTKLEPSWARPLSNNSGFCRASDCPSGRNIPQNSKRDITVW